MRIEALESLWSNFLHAIFVSECDFCEHELCGNDFNRICKHCASVLNKLAKAHLRSARCETCDQTPLINQYYSPSKLKSKRARQKKIRALPKLLCSDCQSNNQEKHQILKIANRSLFSSDISTSAKTKLNLAQKLVYDFKFKKHPSYAKTISYLCEKYLFAYLANFDVLVPIPLSSTGFIERGFCQVTTVTRLITKKLNIPTALLVKRNAARYQVPQHQLTRRERLDLIEGKYLLDKSILKRLTNVTSILLIDDIYTTGATIQHVGELLHRHLPKVKIASFTFLRTPLSKESNA